MLRHVSDVCLKATCSQVDRTGRQTCKAVTLAFIIILNSDVCKNQRLAVHLNVVVF